MNWDYSVDNIGQLVPSSVEVTAPELASGQTVATGTAGDDVTFTVTAGRSYLLMGLGTAVLASLTGVTSTAANIEYFANAGEKFIIKIPDGVTTIYLEGDTSSKNVYLVAMAQR